MNSPQLIAIAGVARSGKDTLADILIQQCGYTKLAYGHVIKDFFAQYIAGEEGIARLKERLFEANPLLTLEQWDRFLWDVVLPFERLDAELDAFTEYDPHKMLLRPVLEQGGDLIYDWVSQTYFDRIDAALLRGERIINPRLVRVREAQMWRRRGGQLMLIDCLHVDAVSQWEKDALTELKRSGLITRILPNWQDAANWNQRCQDLADELTFTLVGA